MMIITNIYYFRFTLMHNLFLAILPQFIASEYKLLGSDLAAQGMCQHLLLKMKQNDFLSHLALLKLSNLR